MAHVHNEKGRPFIVLDGDFLELYTDQGQHVPWNVKIRLTDALEETPTAICVFVVNIVSDKEEMLKEIEKYNQTP